jgi:hypothetical protein
MSLLLDTDNIVTNNAYGDTGTIGIGGTGAKTAICMARIQTENLGSIFRVKTVGNAVPISIVNHTVANHLRVIAATVLTANVVLVPAGVWLTYAVGFTSGTAFDVRVCDPAGTITVINTTAQTPAQVAGNFDRFRVGTEALHNGTYYSARGERRFLRVFNTYLSDAELRLENLSQTPVKTGCVANWPLANATTPQNDTIGAIPLTLAGTVLASNAEPPFMSTSSGPRAAFLRRMMNQ